MKHLRTLIIIATLAVSLLGLTACQEPASPLEDYNWELVRYGKPGSITEALPDVKVTAFFDSETKTVNGKAGCNQYSGSYTTEKVQLSLPGPLAVTEMWCGDEINQQETEYLKILQSADRFELEHGNLFIYSGTAMLFFKRSDAPPPDIKNWGE